MLLWPKNTHEADDSNCRTQGRCTFGEVAGHPARLEHRELGGQVCDRVSRATETQRGPSV